MTQLELSKHLNIPRRTVSYYQSLGCPKDLDGALAWVADYKTNRYPGAEAFKIQSTPAIDGSFEARLERLRGEEMSLAGEIEAVRNQLVGLTTQIGKSEIEAINRQQIVLNNRLAILRRQHLAVSKSASELELKKVSLSRDLIDINTAHDVFVKLCMRFGQYVRHFLDGDSEPEVRRCYYTFANVIAGELNKMVRDLITELRNPSKEHQL